MKEFFQDKKIITTLLFVMVAVPLASCRYGVSSAVTMQLHLCGDVTKDKVYMAIDNVGKAFELKKDDRSKDDRLSEKTRKLHPISYRRWDNKLIMKVMDYSSAGHIQINIFDVNENSPTSFSEKGIVLFNNVKETLSDVFPDCRLEIVQPPNAGKDEDN